MMTREALYQLHHGDCLDILPTLADNSVDAIIADPPYGTTACKWDSVIPFEPMWKELKRVIKLRGASVLFGSQPFTSALVMSNPAMFKYSWVWEKDRGSNFAAVKWQPMKEHEDLLVFGNRAATYNPIRIPRSESGKARAQYVIPICNNGKRQAYNGFQDTKEQWRTPDDRCPRSIIRFNRDRGLHPTQKPVALMEYLVKTYTNAGDAVLDFTAGSGTTGVACVNTGRDFIGIEKDANYFAIAEKRIADAQAARVLPLFAEAANVYADT